MTVSRAGGHGGKGQLHRGGAGRRAQIDATTNERCSPASAARGAAQPARGAAAAHSPPPFVCLDSCAIANNAEREDGGEDPAATRAYGTDCTDCGNRLFAAKLAAEQPQPTSVSVAVFATVAAAVAPAAKPAAPQPQPARRRRRRPALVAAAAAQFALAAATIATAAQPAAAQSAAPARHPTPTGKSYQVAAGGETCADIGGTRITSSTDCLDFGSHVLANTLGFDPNLTPNPSFGGLNNGQPPGCHIACGVVGFEYDCAIVGHTFGFRTVEQVFAAGTDQCQDPCREICIVQEPARAPSPTRRRRPALPMRRHLREEPDAGTDGVRNAY